MNETVDGLRLLGFWLLPAVLYAVVFSTIAVVIWRKARHRQFYWVLWLGALGISFFGCVTLAWQFFLIEPPRIKTLTGRGPEAVVTMAERRMIIRAYMLQRAVYLPIWLSSFPVAMMVSALTPKGISRKKRWAVILSVIIVSASLLGVTLQKANRYKRELDFVMQYR